MPKYETAMKLAQAQIARWEAKEAKRIKLIVVESLENLISGGGVFFGKNIIMPNGTIWTKICNRWQLTEDY